MKKEMKKDISRPGRQKAGLTVVVGPVHSCVAVVIQAWTALEQDSSGADRCPAGDGGADLFGGVVSASLHQFSKGHHRLSYWRKHWRSFGIGQRLVSDCRAVI